MYPIDGWDDEPRTDAPPFWCGVGFHRWPKWEPPFYSGHGTFQKRTCAKCGYTSVAFLTSTALPDTPPR